MVFYHKSLSNAYALRITGIIGTIGTIGIIGTQTLLDMIKLGYHMIPYWTVKNIEFVVGSVWSFLKTPEGQVVALLYGLTWSLVIFFIVTLFVVLMVVGLVWFYRHYFPKQDRQTQDLKGSEADDSVA
ncbi:uncharacterized protein BCR38DRAFT_439586 [Pseudomassariella vexata]|uniref:Uncharacterized protein n=1 Tax=Pseudomassariella vexata TaxID=1141098 RepID=A0A1Y2DPK3_9PEZI|nr:uncharacterized protein BCR38DRAFT_439586 [Pseudomassariella vexata]ORY61211.1 hypothetical protein BCR38DRAFT_439586 [Pseudomassariella vexata]